MTLNPNSYRNALNAARLAALAGQEAALKWAPNLAGDFGSTIVHLNTALRELRECGPKQPEPSIGELKDIYTIARHVGIPGNKIDNFIQTAAMCGYVLVRETAGSSDAQT